MQRRDQAKIAKRAGTTRPKSKPRTRMGDDTLVGSARSPLTSPCSASTTISPKTTFTIGMGTFGTGRRRSLHSLADVVSEPRKSNEEHAGMSLFSSQHRDGTDDVISDG